jgi:hypothetical protein
MRRPVRLDSATAWIARKGPIRVGEYARRYGVDRYTAFQDMVAIGAAIAEGDRKYAVRPPPVPKRRPKPASEVDEWPDIIEWGGELMYVAGWTSGGAPYGVPVEGFDESGSPIYGEV